MVTDPIPLLSEASWTQICEELANRGNNLVVGLISNVDTPEERFRMFYSGGSFAAIGVARCIQTEVIKKVLEASPITQPEDRT